MINKYTLLMEPVSTYSIDQNISSPYDIYKFLCEHEHADKRPEEHVYTLFLDTKHDIIGVDDTTSGATTASAVSAEHIFKSALLCNAVAVAIAHNHPSGNSTPSQPDHDATKKLSDAGKLLSIPLIDHIVIGANDYYSFRTSQPDLF